MSSMNYIVDCGKVGELRNGNITYTSGTIVNSTATFTCDKGYTLFGNNSTVCQLTGNWSDYNVNCTTTGNAESL